MTSHSKVYLKDLDKEYVEEMKSNIRNVVQHCFHRRWNHGMHIIEKECIDFIESLTVHDILDVIPDIVWIAPDYMKKCNDWYDRRKYDGKYNFPRKHWIKETFLIRKKVKELTQ